MQHDALKGVSTAERRSPTGQRASLHKLLDKDTSGLLSATFGHPGPVSAESLRCTAGLLRAFLPSHSSITQCQQQSPERARGLSSETSSLRWRTKDVPPKCWAGGGGETGRQFSRRAGSVHRKPQGWTLSHPAPSLLAAWRRESYPAL